MLQERRHESGMRRSLATLATPDSGRDARTYNVPCTLLQGAVSCFKCPRDIKVVCDDLQVRRPYVPVTGAYAASVLQVVQLRSRPSRKRQRARSLCLCHQPRQRSAALHTCPSDTPTHDTGPLQPLYPVPLRLRSASGLFRRTCMHVSLLAPGSCPPIRPTLAPRRPTATSITLPACHAAELS